MTINKEQSMTKLFKYEYISVLQSSSFDSTILSSFSAERGRTIYFLNKNGIKRKYILRT